MEPAQHGVALDFTLGQLQSDSKWTVLHHRAGWKVARLREVEFLDPFRCRMWDYHDRLEETITEESCQTEIASFHAHGQVVPVLGRRLPKDATHDIELIFGARRLFVARHLSVPIKVELRDLTDREAIIAMGIENRQRKDISAYERGLSYRRWLKSKQFESQTEIANALKISASQVSRLLQIARLPSVIME